MANNLTYKSSGVDIDKANAFVKNIQKDVKSTLTKNVLRNPGAFGSLFSLDKSKYKNPVLVSSTDGVGTKLLIAQSIGKHDTVGIDLVAMNVNDVLCTGAKPLFFLDYIACGKVHVNVLTDVVKGITEGCRQSDCSLIGGETAEMPGMYDENEYDLAGFAVGIVDQSKIVDGSKIKEGDVVIGLPSSGIHSNGYSLVRKVFSKGEIKKRSKEILAPTRIYVKDVAAILERFSLKGIAHITGGAWYEKLTKILPQGLCFSINKGSWPIPEIFQIMQKRGKISNSEMYRTFNMGIGLALVCAQKDASQLKRFLSAKKIRHYEIGEVIKNSKEKVVFK